MHKIEFLEVIEDGYDQTKLAVLTTEQFDELVNEGAYTPESADNDSIEFMNEMSRFEWFKQVPIIPWHSNDWDNIQSTTIKNFTIDTGYILQSEVKDIQELIDELSKEYEGTVYVHRNPNDLLADYFVGQQNGNYLKHISKMFYLSDDVLLIKRRRDNERLRSEAIGCTKKIPLHGFYGDCKICRISISR